jgi:hypothetical protein
MKHAGAAALDQLEDLLAQIRALGLLKEKKRGVFYRKSSAAIHFHEDPLGFFADLRGTGGWERLPVNTAGQRRAMLRRLHAVIDSQT